MPGECCLHVIDLRWDRQELPLSMLQQAVLRPQRNMYVWGACAAVILTTMIAAYVGWTYEWQRRRALASPLEEADLKSDRLLWALMWLTIRIASASGAVMSRVFGCRSCTGLRQRLSAAFVAAATAGMESLAFWFDVLWLHGTWMNQDVRYRPYALAATGIIVAGCLSFCAISLRLIFSNVRGDKKALLNWPVAKGNPALWAAVIVASWALSPELLKLLPWSSRNYAGLPVVSAMYTVFAIKVAYKSALILLKSMMLMHLNAWQNMIIYTLLFNATLWVRNILQSALAAAALRAEKTKWTRISIFLSYRVNPDQVLVGQLCAPTVTEPTRTR